MAIDSTMEGTASVRPGLSRVIIAGTIGNVLEGFDFIVYGFFAVIIAAMITRERPGRTDAVPSIVESMAITHPATVLNQA